MEIPLYMDSPFPNSMLVVDENDNAVYQGMVDVTFTVLIPRILVEEGRSGPVIQYGHGLLGTQDEVRTGYLGVRNEKRAKLDGSLTSERSAGGRQSLRLHSLRV